MSDNKKEQVTWHLAADLAKIIFSYVNRGMGAYARGDLVGWFVSFSTLREIINFDLSPDERKLFDEKEREIYAIEAQMKKFDPEVVDAHRKHPEFKNSKGKYSLLVRSYSRYLMDTLYAMGFFPKREDRTKLSF